MNFFKLLSGVLLSAALVACGGGGGSPGANGSDPGGTPTPTPTTPTDAVASLNVQVAAASVSANSTSPTQVTVYALDAANGLLANAVINLSATGGVLSSSQATTGANGQAIVQFTPGFSDQANRIAVITATSNGRTARGQIAVTGGTLALNSAVTSLAVGATTTVAASVKDLNGNALSGITVNFSSGNDAVVVVGSTSGTTNGAGIASFTVMGVGPGSASVNASAIGTSQALSFTVTGTGAGFYFASPANGSVIQTNTTQTLTVQADGVANVTFVSTLGFFGNGTANQQVAVVGNVATVNFNTTGAGLATIQAFNTAIPSTRSSLQLIASQPPSAANKLLLNANKTIVPVSVGGSQNEIVVTARAVQTTGGVDQPVANVPVQFTLSGGPGGGEFLTKALDFSDANGFVTTTFVAGSVGSIPSGTSGLRIHAAILNTAIQTGVSPSSNDLLLTIGGNALSVAFGQATVIEPSVDNTTYKFPHSVQVTDANGNGVAGAVVTLSVKPYAFSTGGACGIASTFCSEDRNGNGSRDAGEDGVRIALPNNLSNVACDAVPTTGSLDNLLTPNNSTAGSVPATVTTGATGIAGFDLNYLKASALWVVVRLTATVNANGTESSSSTIFRLPASEEDIGPPCLLPNSPFVE